MRFKKKYFLIYAHIHLHLGLEDRSHCYTLRGMIDIFGQQLKKFRKVVGDFDLKSYIVYVHRKEGTDTIRNLGTVRVIQKNRQFKNQLASMDLNSISRDADYYYNCPNDCFFCQLR